MHGADAILVLLALVEDGLAGELIQAAEDLEMEALVEVHDEAELERALDLGRPIIGVNARDLAHARGRPRPPDELLRQLPHGPPAHRRVGHRDARPRARRARRPAPTRCSSAPR